MIDKDGFLRCDGCYRKFGHVATSGKIEKLTIICHNSKCKRGTVFNYTPPLDN